MCNETACISCFVFCCCCETGLSRGLGSLVEKSGKFQGVGGGLTITPWNGNSKGVGGIKLKNTPWEGYGYFLEPHIENT